MCRCGGVDDGDVGDCGSRQDDEDVAAVAVTVASVWWAVAAEVAERRFTRCGESSSVADTAHCVCNMFMAHDTLLSGLCARHRVVGVSARDVSSAEAVDSWQIRRRVGQA